MDIASTVLTVCEKLWKLGQLVNQMIDDFKEQKENLEEFKIQIDFFQENLNSVQSEIEKYQERNKGDEIIKKTANNKKLSEYDHISNWIDEKINRITHLMNETGGFTNKGGFFSKIKNSIKAVKMSNSFCSEMKQMGEEMKQKNEQFKTKIMVVQTQLLGELADTMDKVWTAQRDDPILKGTHETTTWFWITSFKSGDLNAKRGDFEKYLSYAVLEYNFSNDDRKITQAMQIAVKIANMIDKDHNVEVDKDELRKSIFEHTGDAKTPFEDYLATMIKKTEMN